MTAFEADLDRLHAWLNEAASRGAVPVVCGANGDMDTVASAVALAAALPQAMACGRHLGRLAKRLVEDEQAPFRRLGRPTAWPSALGGLVVVDAAAPSQVDLDLPEGVPVCVLDHHATDGWPLGGQDLSLKWPVSATTEIVTAYLSRHHPAALTAPVKRLLMAGLITDTGRFKHAQASSFRSALTLLEDDELDYRTLVDRIEADVDVTSSDHGALLKGLQRATTTDAGPWRLVTTRAGTLEGRLASMLLGTGADVCFVVRHRDGKTRVTGRARATACREGLHLGRLLEELAAVHGGEGGGHDGAAGWTSGLDRVAAETAALAAVAATPRHEVNP